MADHKDVIGEAISDYLAKNYPDAAMMTKYFVTAEFINEDGGASWFIKAPEGQTLGDTHALVNWAGLDLQHQISRYLDRIYDEDNE